MRRISTFLLMAIMLFSLSACGNSNQNSESTQSKPERTQQSAEEQAENTQPDGSETKPEQEAAGNALVIYFSCTGNTEAVAKEIASQTGAELIQIMPEKPYTDEDINYRNDDCRANKEQNDDSARPVIAGEALNLSEYDTLYIGYPIWWGKLPKIMLTFFDTYDLSGKTILPFCTSGGSGISTSVSEIVAEEPDADVTEGLQVSGTASADCKDTVAEWLEVNGR